jgi:lipopolysaccharide/colanic/teichoic acid biosynthesis glycosyltransferase
MSVPAVVEGVPLLAKRAIDMVGAALALLLLSPILLAVAVAVKLTSPGPVLFTQLRYGRDRRRFRMYKFRTMVDGAEAQQAQLEELNEVSGPAFKIRRDPRITAVGAFLRRTSLDEFPQLWNVLCGDMSLVGPRPLPLRDVNLIQEPWLMRRFSVFPGITGLWQVSGRSDVPFDDWIRLDLDYIDRWSLVLDLWIMARTIPAVLSGRGAS